MGIRKIEFAADEWYHCYSRGVEKRKTFISVRDYQRFIEAMYLSNSSGAHHRSDLLSYSHAALLNVSRGKPLVAIGAWCLMPNHFHILMKELAPNGISKYMQKLGTAYTMYFNKKNTRVGGLFVKPFRAKHISKDAHFNRIGDYIHLNAADLFDPAWRKGKAQSLVSLEKKLIAYQYSSLPDYAAADRPENSLLDEESKELFRPSKAGLGSLLAETAKYYGEIGV